MRLVELKERSDFNHIKKFGISLSFRFLQCSSCLSSLYLWLAIGIFWQPCPHLVQNWHYTLHRFHYDMWWLPVQLLPPICPALFYSRMDTHCAAASSFIAYADYKTVSLRTVALSIYICMDRNCLHWYWDCLVTWCCTIGGCVFVSLIAGNGTKRTPAISSFSGTAPQRCPALSRSWTRTSTGWSSSPVRVRRRFNVRVPISWI